MARILLPLLLALAAGSDPPTNGLFDEDPAGAVEAAYALWRADPELAEVQDAVVRALRERPQLLLDPLVGYLEDQGGASVPILREFLAPERYTLENNNPYLFLFPRRLLAAFRRIGPEAAVVAPELVPFLDLGHRSLEEPTAILLGEMGEAGVLALFEEIRREGKHAGLAALALDRIGPGALPWIVPRLDSDKPLEHAAARRSVDAVLTGQGRRTFRSHPPVAIEPAVARPLVSALLDALEDPDRETQRVADRCLCRLRLDEVLDLEGVLRILRAGPVLCGIPALEVAAHRREWADTLIPELKALVLRPGPDRARTIRILLDFGVDPRTLVEEWIAREDSLIRSNDFHRAIRCLGALGEDVAGVEPWLLGILRGELPADVSPDSATVYRTDAADALGDIRWEDDRTVVASLREVLRAGDEHFMVQSSSATALLALRPGDPAAVAWFEWVLLGEDDISSNLVSSQWLPRLGSRAVGIGDIVARGIDEASSETEVSRWVRLAAALGPEARSAIPQLLGELRRPTEERSRWASELAAGALAAIGDAAVPALFDALLDPDPRLRSGAAHALRESPASLEAGVALFVATLARQPQELREWNAQAFGPIVASHPEAAPILRALAGDEVDGVRIAALRSLGADRSAATIRLVTERLRDRSIGPDERAAAMDAIGEIGPAAAGALSDLLARLERSDRHEAGSLARALGGIGEAALADLLRCLDEPGKELPSIRALGEMGAKAGPAVPSLRRRLRDPRPAIRAAAAHALERIEFPTARPR